MENQIKYDRLYPEAEFNESFGILQYHQEPKVCSGCRRETRWRHLAYNLYFCSESCIDLYYQNQDDRLVL